MKTRKRLVKKGELKLTLEELHRRLWNWLAYNPGYGKDRWPCWGYNGGVVPKVRAHCFACEHTGRDGNLNCQINCPIKWSGLNCVDTSAEYSIYVQATNIEVQQRMAKVIAKLPWHGKPVYVKLLK